MKIILLLLTTMIFLGCEKKNEPAKNVENIEIPQIQTTAKFDFAANGLKESRSMIMKSWLDSTLKIAVESKDKDAMEVADYLLSNTYVGKPLSDRVVSMDDVDNKKKWILFVSLFPEDINLSKFWKDNYSEKNYKCYAVFVPSLKSIILKDDKNLSDISKAVISLHEGYHAKSYVVENKYSINDDNSMMKNELEAYNMQFRILARISGGGYKKILAAEIARLQKEIQINKQTDSLVLPENKDYSKEIIEVFGKNFTSEDINFLNNSIWMNGLFEYFDKNGILDPTAQKIELIKAVTKSQ